MKTIFKVEGVFLDKEENRVWTIDYILTQESVDYIKERVLPKYIENTKNVLGDDFLHHINVIELPMDKIIEDGEFVAEYTFLPDCTLYISKEYRNLNGDTNFKGRNEDELPLKKGDKVEWFEDDCVRFGVIYTLPPKVGEFKFMDAFDDCYTVLEGVDEIPYEINVEEYMLRHQHIDVNRVFK